MDFWPALHAPNLGQTFPRQAHSDPEKSAKVLQGRVRRVQDVLHGETTPVVGVYVPPRATGIKRKPNAFTGIGFAIPPRAKKSRRITDDFPVSAKAKIHRPVTPSSTGDGTTTGAVV